MKVIDQPQSVLTKVFGHQEFRFYQEKAIHALLNRQDVFVLMPTGGGKSICYQVPALCFEGMAVVISPLISLMQNQVTALKVQGVKAEFFNSTLKKDDFVQIQKRVLAGEIKILYLSPEKFQSTFILDLLKKVPISMFAIDEAHCVSQWGHEFRKDYLNLGLIKDEFKNTPVMALTATADEKVALDVTRTLKLNSPLFLKSSFDRPNIFYRVQFRDQPFKQLLDFLKNHREEVGIIYCSTRDSVDDLTTKLKDQGFNAHSYHAGLSHLERNATQKHFEEDEVVIIVATIAFGMGIDRPNVRFVFHMNLPKNIESYYQETGRAGRDGLPSVAHMLYGIDDLLRNKHMLNQSEADGVYKHHALFKMDQMLNFCELTECRRVYLLKYFNQNLGEDCGHCDVCMGEFHKYNVTNEAKMALSAAFRAEGKFGMGHLVDILRGKMTEKIEKFSHQDLSVFGIGKHFSEKEWMSLFRSLLYKDYLVYSNVEYKTLKLGPKASLILREQHNFEIVKNFKTKETKAIKVKKILKDQSLSTSDSALLIKLKECRTRIAKEMNVPAFIVFNDKTILDMARLKPRTHSEFLLVNGVGERKRDQFGADFLKVISENL